MKLLKVAAAALNQTPLDWDGNRVRIEAAISEARSRGVSVLCLPELCITGYGCEDAFLSPGVKRTALEVLLEIAPHTRGLIVSLGLPLEHAKATYNACCLVADGILSGFVVKRALAREGIHYEPRWFRPWPEGQRAAVRVGGTEVPVGDITFDCGGVLLGFEICEDAWIAQRPGVKLALGEVDVILNPSASHFAFGKHEVRRRLVLESSRALKTSYVYANLLGNEAGRAIYDGDVLIANAGEMVAQGARFSFKDHLLVSAVVDLDLARSRQASLTSEPFRVAALRESCVPVPFVVPEITPERSSVRVEPWETTQDVKNEEFVRAVSLGLFDYLRKSQAHGFVISLSGGADSSAVACLVAYMVSLARAWLDPGELARKLPFLDETHESATDETLTRQLLTTVYQGTRNSSARTRAAAQAVAEQLGTEHVELDVDPLVEQYVALASNALGRQLTWSSDDVALQNIQARVRSPGAWLIANVKRALLLSTSNRSEAAVGYATMDGDTAGGLSPIAGVDKAFLRRWLLWVERAGPSGLHPVSALASVTRQEPTAELRPAEAAQTDEADLMPYDVLDFIERAAIRDKRTPAEVYTLLRVDKPGTPPQTLVFWIERFFLLFSTNQWKRERYAPSFHLDDANLDPKTWCRFPVLSGGYARELRELRSRAQQDERGEGSV